MLLDSELPKFLRNVLPPSSGFMRTQKNVPQIHVKRTTTKSGRLLATFRLWFSSSFLISEQHSFALGLLIYFEDEGISKLFQNISNYLPDNMASHPRKQLSSSS